MLFGMFCATTSPASDPYVAVLPVPQLKNHRHLHPCVRSDSRLHDWDANPGTTLCEESVGEIWRQPPKNSFLVLGKIFETVKSARAHSDSSFTLLYVIKAPKKQMLLLSCHNITVSAAKL